MEFAIILPIVLMLVVGGLHLGLLVLDRTRVTHTAQEAAVGAATNPQGCANVEVVARRIYGSALAAVSCTSNGQEVTVSVTHQFAALLPWLPDKVHATERAVIR